MNFKQLKKLMPCLAFVLLNGASCSSSFFTSLVEGEGIPEIEAEEQKDERTKNATNASFTITFADYDGTVLQISSVNYGELPVFNSTDPVRENEGCKKYTFTSWEPSIVAAVEDVTYKASYKLEYIETDIEEFSVSNEEITQVNDRSIKEVVIPSGIKSIGEEAFAGCENLTTAVITSGVETLGTASFAGCPNLENVIVLDGISQIGDCAFEECPSLKEVVLPKSVEVIGPRAFYACHSLENIVLPDNVTTIEEKVFSECENLTDIKLPKRLVSIGNEAFYNCKKLTSIYLPKSLNNIASNNPFAFSGLETIELDNENPVYETIQGSNVIVKKENKELVLASNKATIPADVEIIGQGAFNGMENLESVTIPYTVKEIKENAFAACRDITIYYDGNSSEFEQVAIGLNAIEYGVRIVFNNGEELISNGYYE